MVVAITVFRGSCRMLGGVMGESESGLLLGHVACPIHGSSDSLSLYEKEEDGGKIVNGYCWSECGFVSTDKLKELEVIDDDCNVIVEFANKSNSKPFIMNENIKKKVEDIINKYPSKGWKERGIPKVTCDFYGVRSNMDEDGRMLQRFYPSTEDGELVGWHVRDCLAKEAKNRGEKVDKPPFYAIGKVRSDCELFGQSKFNKGGKFLVIASGEEDVQAIFTALNTERDSQGKLTLKKYITPVVSTTVGESAIKQIKNNHEFITSFDNVVVMYDNDTAGREGAEKVAKVLKVGQCKIASYQRKDACEHLKRGEIQQIVNTFWKAEKYSPAGIVGSSSTLSALKERASFEKIALPDFAEDMSKMFNGGIALGEITTIAAASSVGKGQPKWEKVLTPEGYVNVGSIKVGDLLIGKNGEPTKVLGTYEQGVKPVYKVTLQDGSFAHCDDSHLWNWSNAHGRRSNKFKTTNVLEMKSYLENNNQKVYLPKNESIKFTKKELPLNPWLLGFLIGDGCLSLDVGFSSVETDLINKVEQIVKEYNLKVVPRTTNKETHNYRISKGYRKTSESNYVMDKLREMGLSCKSEMKFIPELYMLGSENQRLELLQGLFDADGHITKSTANLEYSTTSEKLAYQVKELSRSLGCTARVVKRKSGYKKDGVYKECLDSYRVFIKQPPELLIFSSEKHKVNFKQGRAYARDEVVSIDYVGDYETVCFKVDASDSLYLTNNCIVTHNTTVTNEFLYHFINNSKYRVGVISLESDVGELTENLMSIHTNLKLANMPDEEKLRLYSTPEFEEKHKTLTLTENGEDRYIILDHQGAVTDGALMDKIEYLVKALDCKIIILDPLTLALSGSQNDGMDLFMSDLLRFVKRERIAHVNVVHVRKNSSGTKANSTGGIIHEEDIKGSGSIFQVSMNNILLMRDKENPDPVVRNTTKVVVSKNRRCGNTGPAGFWYYDNYTSRLKKGTDGSSDSAFEDQFKEFDELGAFTNVQLPDKSEDDWEVIDD